MKRTTLIFLLAGLTACIDRDTDGDNLTDAEEADLGTDPDNPDSDGDGLKDGAEVNNGTDPLNTDTDGDGLEDGAEVKDLGTNPSDDDSDDDGIADGVEIDNGSDALDMYSWPGDGIWPDRRDYHELVGDTYGWAETLPDFHGKDQVNGGMFLHQLGGYIVLLDFSAGWCGPCRTAAGEAEELFQEYKGDGFVVVHAMVDDNQSGGGVKDEEFTTDWADQYGLTFPVISGSEINECSDGLYNAGINEGYIPFLVLLNRDLEVVETYVGAGQESAIAADVEELLANE